MKTLENNAAEILKDAKQAASENVPGHLFVGAFGEALRYGYKKKTPEFDCFVGLFLLALPVITTDNEGFISQSKRPEGRLSHIDLLMRLLTTENEMNLNKEIVEAIAQGNTDRAEKLMALRNKILADMYRLYNRAQG